MKRIVSLLLAAALLLSLCACAKKENYRGNGRKLPVTRSCSTSNMQKNGKHMEAAYNWTENGCEITLYNAPENESVGQIIGSYDAGECILRLSMQTQGASEDEAAAAPSGDPANTTATTTLPSTGRSVDMVWRFHYTEAGKIDWWDFSYGEIAAKGVLTREGTEVRLVIDGFDGYNYTATLDRESNTGAFVRDGSQAPFTYSSDGHLWITAKNAAASYDSDGDLLTLLDAEGNGISATTYGEARQTAPWQQTAVLLFYYMLFGDALIRDGEVWKDFDGEGFIMLGLATYMN